MSQTTHRDLEEGNDTGAVDGYHDQPPSQPSQSSGGEFDYDDSSWPLYSMYSKIAQEEDNNMVERCQKDVEGTLVFSGLFSATIATLLSVSIPDLRPNPQDTSAFYLANIYGVLGNVTTPSTLVKPPAFSPPKYAIWVNSLWLLSLSFSLTAATSAMFYQSWALRYISVVQFPWRTPDKRARVRAIFANDNPGPYIFWGTGDEPLYLHISVFLFVIGSLIYLFNINRSVFGAVVWFLLIVAMRYVQVTVQPIYKPAMLLCSPFTPLVLNIYIVILYAVSQACSCISPLGTLSDRMTSHYRVLRNHYRETLEGGKRKEAEEIASKPTSQVDAQILKRILFGLDDDDSLETFFDSIPGFCNSKLVNLHLPDWVGDKFRQTLNGFLDRTFTSNFVSESARSDRLITCLNAAYAALGPGVVLGILDDIFKGRRNEALQSVETGHSLRRWGITKKELLIDVGVRRIVACIVVYAQERDDNWVTLVKEEFGMPEGVLRDNLEHGDSVLLAILIHAARQALRTHLLEREVLQSLSEFDILNTLPGLQRDFCALWNEIILEARHDSYGDPIDILNGIRQAHIVLHQGADAALTQFPAPIADDDDDIRWWPWSYRPYGISSHSPHSTPPYVFVSPTDPPATQIADFPDHWPRQYSLETQFSASRIAALQQGQDTSIVPPFADHTPLHAPGLPWPPPPADLVQTMRGTSQAPAPTSLSFVPATIAPAGTLCHPLERYMLPDVAGGDALDVTESLSKANRIPQSILSGSTLQAIEESTSIPVPDLFPSPVVTCSGVITTELPSFVESPLIKPQHILRAPESPSPSLITTTHPHITPQVTDAHLTASTGALVMHEHDDTQDPNRPIPMEVFHYQHQPTSFASDIADNILPPGDHQHG